MLKTGRELDMVFLAAYGWEISAGIVAYKEGTTNHDCATFKGDMVYKGGHTAWILTYNGIRKGWAYDNPKQWSYPEICAILADYANLPRISTNATDGLQYLRLSYPFRWEIAEGITQEKFNELPRKWQVRIIDDKDNPYGFAFEDNAAYAMCMAFQDFRARFPKHADWRFPK